jgi:transcriptional regulator NrdR family protein|tara:strand:+ start:155 stop:271 length:117 start_codon:yes stop_codon:yes gene_type:complete
MEIMTLVVEKSGKRIEKYNREKLEDSILKAVNKRNMSV